MRTVALLALLISTFASTNVRAGPNLPLCLAIENNYNQCIRNEQARERWRRAEEDEYWDRPDWDRPPWARPHRHRARHRVDCNAWILQLKANGCF
jgi:hypothetical protein